MNLLVEVRIFSVTGWTLFNILCETDPDYCHNDENIWLLVEKKNILVSSLREAAQSSQRVKLAAFKLCVICFDLSSVAYKLHVWVGLFLFSGLWNSVLNYLNLRAGSKCLKGCFIIFISSSFVKEKKTSSYFLWFYPTTHDNKHRPQKKFSARSLDTYHPQLPFFINITMLPVNQ